MSRTLVLLAADLSLLGALYAKVVAVHWHASVKSLITPSGPRPESVERQSD